jgi:glycosyltransferase involved in cell wall biosynthesis
MIILHVNKFFDFTGGSEGYMRGLMQEQERLGFEPHVFSTRSERNAPSSDSRLFVTRYHLDRSDGLVKDAKKAMNYVWNREARKGMERAIRELKPDVIHLHNIYNHLSTSVLAPIRASRIPCVQTLHDYKVAGCPAYSMFTEGAPCERCKDGNYLQAVKHHCISASFVPNLLAALEMGIVKSRQSYERTVRLFLCPSRFMHEKMEDWGAAPGKLRYVPNPTRFPVEPAVRGGGYLLYVGYLSTIKGLESFLEAAARVPELPIKIAGSGFGRFNTEERLRSFVREKGATHVEFLGFVPPDQLASIRARAEAIVLPTISYENASGALLEGMADGLPCLATRIGGNPELIEDGVNGFLVTPNDPEDWLRVLRRFLACPDDVRMKMGFLGREKIQAGRTWDLHAKHVLECYREAGVNV